MHTIQSLTFRQTVELIRRLNGGTAGFDYGKYKLDGLRNIVAAWLQQGCFSAETLQAHVAAIMAESAPGVGMPSIPTFGAAQPAPVIPTFGAPVAAPVAPVAQPVAVAAPVATIPTFAPAPPVAAPVVVAPAPVAIDVAPVAIDVAPISAAPVVQPIPAHTAPQRLAARSLFADQPAIAAALPESLTVMHYADADAPAIDPLYQFDAAQVALAIGALSCAPTLRCWLGGPRGAGKTEFAKQIAARLGRAFFRVNFNRATEAAEFIGDIGLVNQSTQWVDGPVATALRTPGAILLLDELTYAAQGNIAALNPLLERSGAALRLPRTGELLTIAADVAVFVADNTFGHGDASGEYAARGAMGADTINRFAWFIEFDHLPAATEAKVLRAMVQRDCGKKMSKAAADVIVKIMNVARDKSAAGELMGAPSLRNAAAFATALALGIDAPTAYVVSVVRAAPLESHEALRQIFAAHWPAEIPGNDGNSVAFASTIWSA